MDRNNTDRYGLVYDRMSLSARRAWIEMETMLPSWTRYASLSARRAWIEIIGLTYDGLIASGRSPQGERG